ncbi:MAG: hypothetical protein B6U72_00360 [Candidatus Altiarchaeales archaeon ex4484_2]|nr:MAG: hypothetical protein B6U72_00360 [Candidatus Altiarchaeales archaeon ex4484_2]
MSTSFGRKKIVLVLLLLLYSLAPVSSQLMVENLQIKGDVENNIVWLNDDFSKIEVSAECKFNGVGVTPTEFYAEIYPPGYSSPSMKSDEIPYTFRNPLLYPYENPDTHPYLVKVVCKYDDNGTLLIASETEELFIYELTLDLHKEAGEELEVYQGGEFLLKVELELNGKLVTPSHNTFEVYYDEKDSEGDSDWQRFEIISDPALREDYQEILLYVPLHDDDISIDKHDIKVEAEYKVSGTDSRVTDKAVNFIWVNNPIGVDIQDNRIVCPANEVCRKNITSKVVFRAGSIENFELTNVEAVLVSKHKIQKVTVDDLYCDDTTEECSVLVTIPSYISSGDYDLFLTFAYPSVSDYRYKADDSVSFESVIELSGSFKDAAGKIVSAEITLENTDTGETVIAKTNSNGAYSIELLPGVYDIAFKFTGGVVARIFNVSITDFELMSIPGNMIRFDSDHLTSGSPPGVNIVKTVVLESALSSSDLWVYVPYDSKRVNNKEEELRVYRCVDWNFMKSACCGEWEHIPAEVHTIRDAVEFSVNKSAAFVVGENNWLIYSKLDLPTLEVFMGEPVVVEGAVVDNEDNPVSGATVTLSFPEYNLSRSAVSSGTGGFSARIDAPYRTGNLLLNINARKEPYSPVNDSRVIRVSKSKELGIMGASDVESISLNESRVINLSIINSGQTNFTDKIYFEVNGVPSDWYSLSPPSFDGLNVGESRDVSLGFRVSTEMCASGCKKFNLVNFVAKSQEITRSVSFSLEIKEPFVPPEGNETVNEDGGLIGFISLPNLKLPSLGSYYVSLTVIVLLLLLVVNKKKAGAGVRKGIERSGVLARKIKKKSGEMRSGRVKGISERFKGKGISIGKKKKPFRSNVISSLHKAKSEATGETMVFDSELSSYKIISSGKKSSGKKKSGKKDWDNFWKE